MVIQRRLALHVLVCFVVLVIGYPMFANAQTQNIPTITPDVSGTTMGDIGTITGAGAMPGLDACKGKKRGAKCSYVTTGSQKTLSGTKVTTTSVTNGKCKKSGGAMMCVK